MTIIAVLIMICNKTKIMVLNFIRFIFFFVVTIRIQSSLLYKLTCFQTINDPHSLSIVTAHHPPPIYPLLSFSIRCWPKLPHSLFPCPLTVNLLLLFLWPHWRQLLLPNFFAIQMSFAFHLITAPTLSRQLERETTLCRKMQEKPKHQTKNIKSN